VSFETPNDEVQALDIALPAFGLVGELHALIVGIGLDGGLERSLRQHVTLVESALDRGADPCGKLDQLLVAGIDAAGTRGLSYGETVQLLDLANRLGALFACTPAGSPNPAAEADLVGLLGTIEGMGLSNPETTALQGKARAAATKVVTGPNACKAIGELAARIANDTGKPNRLTEAQGATLAAAVSRISTPLGC
jgi:hypothetical protein